MPAISLNQFFSFSRSLLLYQRNFLSRRFERRFDGPVTFSQKKYLDYISYADAIIHDIFSDEQLKGAGLLKAETMQTVYLENRSNLGFVIKQLPPEVQNAPAYTIAALDTIQVGKKDLSLYTC